MQDLTEIALFNDNRVKPAIDKVSICGRSDLDILNDDIESLVHRYGNNQFQYNRKTSEKYMGYRVLHEISYRHRYDNGTYEKFTLALFICLNGNAGGVTPKERRKFKIEFNPQKFQIPDWLANYFGIKRYLVEEVKNIDLAFDFIGFNKKDFQYVLNNGNTTTASIGTMNNKTEYIGFAEKADNRIKIYDKKRERKKYYDMDMETARLEITLKYVHEYKKAILRPFQLQQLKKSALAIQQVYITNNTARDVLTFALSRLSEEDLMLALSMMGVNTRTKYKKLLKKQSGYRLYCDPVEMYRFITDNINFILEKCSISYRYPNF